MSNALTYFFIIACFTQLQAAATSRLLSEEDGTTYYNDSNSVLDLIEEIERDLPLDVVERDVYTLINLALHKPAWESTMAYTGVASRAVDGNKNTNYWVGNTCTCTANGDTNPWLGVDLRMNAKVQRVEVTIRSDCCPHTMNNFVVGLTNTDPNAVRPTVTNVQICGRGPAVAAAGATYPIYCTAGLQPARYVVVMIHGHNLVVCELEVWGPGPGCPPDFIHLPEAKGCYKPVLSNLEWPMAALRCRSLHKDAHLVFINNDNEQNHVKHLLANINHHVGCNQKYGLGDGWWTGGHQVAMYTKSFVWRSTERCGNDEDVEMAYTKWHTDEPNHFSDSGPVCTCAFRGRLFDTWDDCPCTDKFCSLCEIDL